MKITKVTIKHPEYVKEITLDNNKVFRVSPIDDFEEGDEVEVFTNTYGSGFNEMKIDGIRKISTET